MDDLHNLDPDTLDLEDKIDLIVASNGLLASVLLENECVPYGRILYLRDLDEFYSLPQMMIDGKIEIVNCPNFVPPSQESWNNYGIFDIREREWLGEKDIEISGSYQRYHKPEVINHYYGDGRNTYSHQL